MYRKHKTTGILEADAFSSGEPEVSRVALVAELSDLHSSCNRLSPKQMWMSPQWKLELWKCETGLKAYIAASNHPIRKAGTPAPAAEDLINLDITPPKIEYRDPLEKWKYYEAFFPILARLAKIYLSLQATSAPTERVFSAASRVTGAKRAKLKPTTASKLLYVSRTWEWYFSEKSLEEALEEIMEVE
jgi:hAT family C-terminal dimerisation region